MIFNTLRSINFVKISPVENIRKLINAGNKFYQSQKKVEKLPNKINDVKKSNDFEILRQIREQKEASMRSR